MDNNKLKIGLFIDTFFPMVDGVINVVDNYARILSKSHDVTVFTSKTRKKGFNDSSLPYKVVRSNCLPLFFLDYDMPTPKFSKKFKQELKDNKFDIIHIHSPFGIGKMGIKYAKKNNIPVIATLHSQFYKDFLRESHSKLIAKFMLNNVVKTFDKCDECFAVNENVANIYYNEYGLKTKPSVLKNGTDFLPVEDFNISELKQEFNILEDEKVFLFVGRINYLKNIDFIARSLKILKEKNFKFKMLFVGSGQDEDRFKRYISFLNLDNEVILTGKITDRKKLSQIYKMANLFLFPSLYDCNSLVQIEAASQSTPTLFLEGSATACSINDNINGYLSKNSEEDYANKIFEIFNDTQKYNEVCKNAFNDLYISWGDAIKNAIEEYKKKITNKKDAK